MKFSIYDTNTGLFTSVKDVPSQQEMDDLMLVIAQDNRGYIEGDYVTTGDYYIRSQVVYPLPPKSDPWLVWDINTESWIDERTPQDIADALQATRASASMSKLEFLKGIKSHGILSVADVLMASKGEWPSALVPFLDQLGAADPGAAVDVQIEWASATMIDRMDAKVLTIASVLGVTDSVVDNIFGIQG